MLCLATLVAGYYSANGQLYRFAAAELTSPAHREKAVSLVLAGGLLGAVAGPKLANHARNLLSVPFVGAYLALWGWRCCPWPAWRPSVSRHCRHRAAAAATPHRADRCPN